MVEDVVGSGRLSAAVSDVYPSVRPSVPLGRHSPGEVAFRGGGGGARQGLGGCEPWLGVQASEGSDNFWAAVSYRLTFVGYFQMPASFGGAFEDFQSLKSAPQSGPWAVRVKAFAGRIGIPGPPSRTTTPAWPGQQEVVRAQFWRPEPRARCM